MRPSLGNLIAAFAVAFAAAFLSIELSRVAGSLATVWIANAAMFVACIRRSEFRDGRFFASFALAIAAANLATGSSPLVSTALAGANTAEVLFAVGGWLPVFRAEEYRRDPRQILVALGVGGIAAPVIGAVLGATALTVVLGLPFSTIAWNWYAGAMLGAMIVLPPGLTAGSPKLLRDLALRPVLIFAALAVVTIAISLFALHTLRYPFVLISLPVLAAAAFLPPFGTALVGSVAALSVSIANPSLLDDSSQLSTALAINASAALAIIPPFLFSIIRSRLMESQARLSLNETLFRTAMANSAIGMAIVARDGRLSKVNQRFADFLGMDEETLVTKDFREITHADDLAIDEGHVNDLLSGKRDRYEIEKRYLKADGEAVWGLLAVSIIREQEGLAPDFFVAQIVDIDGRKRSEEALHRTNQQLYDEKERLRITLYSIGDAVITTDENARVTFLNPVAERMTGWSKAEAVGLAIGTVFPLVREKTGEPLPNPVELCLRQGDAFYLSEGCALVSRDGSRLSIQDSAAPVRSPDGIVHGAVLVFTDVTKTRGLQRELLHFAMHDALTGLPNRRSFENGLNEACTAARGTVARHTVGYLDLDRFKLINDTSGHSAGDLALREVAKVLVGLVRKEDLVARLGGDEFGLLLFDCPVEKAVQIGEKIVLALRSTGFRWEGRSYELGASIGLTELSSERTDPAELMMEADVACYAGKSSGRSRVVVYDGGSSGAPQHRREMDMAARLKDAIENDQLRLYAQRIVHRHQPSLRSFEVFIRLVDDTGAIVRPVDFIPAAERYNLMGQIDRWVISHVAAEVGELLAGSPDISVSINISTDSLGDETCWDFIEKELVSHGVPARQVCFEITETSVMSNTSAAIDFARRAHAFGCRIALDDFGTGMSSFAYLKMFTADMIKIDASFIRDIEKSDRDRKIVQAILGLAHSLSIEAVAEGVETSGQLDWLESLGVSAFQGYLWERPRPLGVAMAPLGDPAGTDARLDARS